MNCKFHSLYFSDEGYVVKCKDCGHFQLAFISTMLTLTEQDFELLRIMVKHQCREHADCFAANSKSVLVKTPSAGFNMLLTRREINRLDEILDEADSEYKALLMMNLFNQPSI